jgi:hypothetical protein
MGLGVDSKVMGGGGETHWGAGKSLNDIIEVDKNLSGVYDILVCSHFLKTLNNSTANYCLKLKTNLNK